MSNHTPPQVAPFGTWQSPISIETIFNQPSAPAYPFRWCGDLFWLQALPDDGGRIVLMRWSGIDKEEPVCLTPGEFNIRSRVHEYGGCCFCVHGDEVIFNNFSDGRLYSQLLGGKTQPLAITPEDDKCVGFADIKPAQHEGMYIAVYEYLVEGKENRNALVVIDSSNTENPVTELVSGCDFYACPSVSAKGDAVVWFEWDHPGMPWDQTRVCRGSLELASGEAGHKLICNRMQRLMDAPNCAANQTGFLSNGSLLYACDSIDANWSGLYLWQEPKSQQLTNIEAEFGQAHWVFGQRRWVETEPGIVFAIATGHDGDVLYRFDVANPNQLEAVVSEASISQLNYSEGKLQFVVSPEDRNSRVAEYNVDNGSVVEWSLGNDQPANHATAVPFQCSTRDGEMTFGYLYRPYNSEFTAPQGAKPPLVVMVHGGPTSRTDKSYQPLKQYFASLGFAVLDINHRGSTGYGRAYRQRLLGQWGEVDAMDIADSIAYLADQGEVNPDAVFIRGGSAGGYAVLRTLTVYPDLFAGGACYYGIGNLITLSEITHKFEARYTDMLVGEPFSAESARAPRSRYRSRSPIFQMDKLTAPIILFQGLLDKIVPPAVTREVVELLESRGIPHAYTEYANEGHGFRSTENRVDSLQRETGFFIDILTDNSGS